MPCYEAPPKWEGDARNSAEQAVTFLCEYVRAIGYYDVQLPLLEWYIAHREIDLRIAKDNRMGKSEREAYIIANDIARAMFVRQERSKP